MPSWKKKLDRYLSQKPWVLFAIFFVTNTLLSYSPLSLVTKCWIGFGGLLLPLILARWRMSLTRTKDQVFEKTDFLPAAPLWVCVFLTLGALTLRFCHLKALSVWPHYDEGVYGYYAIQLDQHWDWRLFYGISRAPAVYIWILSLAFRFFGTSLTVLWLVPAFVSAAVLPIAYLAARQFFSRSFSTICVLLLAFGFWPLFLGRFSFMTGMILWAECLAFLLLGKILSSRSFSERRAWSLALGFLLGVGFFIHLHWFVIAVLLIGTLFHDLLRGGNSSRRTIGYWLVPLVLFLAPFLYFSWVQGTGSFLLHLAAFHQTSAFGQISVALSYLSALLWGVDPNWHSYQPVWGGFLNPVLGAFFLMGILEMDLKYGKGLYLWLWGALGICLLPGILTSDLEPFRLVPLLPILFIVSALGLAKIVLSLPKGKTLWVLMLALTFSAGLDTYHLFGAYHQVWSSLGNWEGYEKSYSRYQAYLELDRIRRENGPGYLLDAFVPGLSDQTLGVACGDFNLAARPDLKAGPLPWVAVLVNANFQPFLKARFPDGKSYAVSKDLEDPDGGWMLWVMPADPARMETVKLWLGAALSLRPFIEKSLLYVPGQPMAEQRRALEEASPFFQKDPLLISCYWEKMADLEFREAMMGGGPLRSSSALPCLEKAVQGGYPAAHLYFKSGVLLGMAGERVKAREAFRKAAQAPLDLTFSRRYLDGLNH